jgi:hypothetical protein
MALEKYFLRVGEKIESNILEDWLLYILKNSESASISSVVASIVLAYPEKTYDINSIGNDLYIGFACFHYLNKYQPFVQSYQSQRLHTAVLIY